MNEEAENLVVELENGSEESPEDFREKIRVYAELDVISKNTAAKMKPLNLDIKQYMKKSSLSELQGGPWVAKYFIQEKSEIRQEMLLQRLKTLGLTEAIITVEAVDSAKVKQLLYEGRLSPVQIADCNETAIIEVLKIVKKKG